MNINEKYFVNQIYHKSRELNRLDYMIIKIKEIELLVKYGLATQEELEALEKKYVEEIQKKQAIRNKIKELEAELHSSNN